MKGADSESVARQLESFGIRNKPKDPGATRREWDLAVPAGIEAAVDLGVKLD